MNKPTWTPITIRLGDVTPWQHNPRMSTKAQAVRLINSEKKFGQPQPFSVSPTENGKVELYDGHQRYSAWLTVYGEDHTVAAMQSSRHLTHEERQEFVITMHAGAVGSWDWQVVSGWDAPKVTGWGMDKDTLKGWNNDALNLKEMLKAQEPETADAPAQVDRAAELLEKWQVVTGDLWQIGEHRLICGDCTDAAIVARVMGGERAVLMLTDPPYGVDYGELVRGRENQKQGGWDDIQNDALSDDDLYNLLLASLHGAGAQTGFVFHPPGERRWLFWNAVKENGWKVSQEIVWVKNAMVFGRADYQWRHEPCLYIKKDGARKKQEDRTQTTVWEVKKPTNSIHPTQKPTELFEIAVRNHTESGDIVYEPFSGSGTTLVACQNLGRRGRGIEISPAYVAVALERMSQAFPSLDIKRI